MFRWELRKAWTKSVTLSSSTKKSDDSTNIEKDSANCQKPSTSQHRFRKRKNVIIVKEKSVCRKINRKLQ